MKKVIITGSSRGIGLACAEAFAASNCDVILNADISSDKAEKEAKRLTEAYGIRAFAVKADVSSEEDVKRLFDTAVSLIGEPDILVNNAGKAHIGLFQDMSDDEWDRLFAVNTKSVFLCSREAVKYMLHSHSGVIINISSVWGQVGASCEVAYSASKAAVTGFTKALAKELAPSGIRVNCICPGVIDTAMNASLTAEIKNELEAEIPLGRIGSASEVASTAVFLASEQASYITGQILGVNGGFAC